MHGRRNDTVPDCGDRIWCIHDVDDLSFGFTLFQQIVQNIAQCVPTLRLVPPSENCQGLSKNAQTPIQTGTDVKLKSNPLHACTARDWLPMSDASPRQNTRALAEQGRQQLDR